MVQTALPKTPIRSLISVLLATVVSVGVIACSVDRPPGGGPSVTNRSPTPAPTLAPPTATPFPIPVPAEASLGQEAADGTSLGRGGWAVDGVVLTFQAPVPIDQTLVPEVEVVPLETDFAGKATDAGTATASQSGVVEAEIILKTLPPGRYHWQARLIDEKSGRAGPWAAFAGGDDGFGIIDGVPAIEHAAIEGATHQIDGVPVIGKDDVAKASWSVTANPPESVDHIAYSIDQVKADAGAPPPDGGRLGPTVKTLPLVDLTDGPWFVHLWVVDRVGQISPPATVPVLIQRTPPKIEGLVYRTWVTNPRYQTLPFRFSVSARATIDLVVLPEDSDAPLRTFHLAQQPAGQLVEITWDGLDSSTKSVPPGTYRFRIRAVDEAGNPVEVQRNDLHLTSKVIQVWLAQQSLTASDGSGVILQSLVTSGGQALPTRTGTFEVESKAAPFVFHSPYPRGSRFWYPDTPANYAMLFDPGEANFLHDAPWRTVFGPGTNGPGTPGYSVWAGSHGCVELPTSAMKKLFDWTQLGTPVIVHA